MIRTLQVFLNEETFMARAKQYTKQEVLNILTTREGLASPVSGEKSHIFSLHVGVEGLQISDRLMGTLNSDASHPIIMGPKGSILPEVDHRNLWKSLNPGMNTKQAKSAFSSFIDNSKTNSGSFVDKQQAIVVAKVMLNSPEGQTQLGLLDSGAKNRVFFKLSLDMLRDNGFQMNFAGSGGGNDDITHLEYFNQAGIVIDRLDPDGIHVQTLYPIK